MGNLIKEKEQAAKMTIVPLESLPIKIITTVTPSTISTRDVADQLANAIPNMCL